MRFNATLNVDFTKWTQVKMERENNMKEYKGIDEEMPKFGAGSEFGRDAREEARKKKFGIVSRKYKPDDQPWILKAGGKTGKKFKGIREGGVGEHASYYIFTHAQDGAIDAFPLQEWYNFQPIQRYKTLSAEEAEAEFTHRNTVVNYFSLMTRKRLRNDEEGGDDEELQDGAKGKKSNKKEKDLKISEMDEWMNSSDDDSESDDGDEEKKKPDEEEKKNKKKAANLKKKKKKKKNDSEDEDHAFEESDDGDEEGRECDYISDSSESGSDLEKQKEIKSVAEEDALRKLLVSDEDDEDESDKEKKDDDDKNEDDENKEKEKEKDKTGKDGEKRKDKKKKKKQSKKKDSKKSAPGKDSSSDFSSDSDSDSDVPKDKEKDNKKPNSAHSSRSATPTPAASTSDSLKRKQDASPDLMQSKKMKLDNFSSVPATPFTPSSSESGITEEAVRRYLMRKPMTTTELLQKFKSKKTGLTSEQLVNTMTGILKKINPTKQTIKNKMYLFIKSKPN